MNGNLVGPVTRGHIWVHFCILKYNKTPFLFNELTKSTWRIISWLPQPIEYLQCSPNDHQQQYKCTQHYYLIFFYLGSSFLTGVKLQLAPWFYSNCFIPSERQQYVVTQIKIKDALLFILDCNMHDLYGIFFYRQRVSYVSVNSIQQTDLNPLGFPIKIPGT